MQQTRSSILFFVVLLCALALAASAQSPAAAPSEKAAKPEGLQGFDQLAQDKELTAEQELEEVMSEFNEVNADCDTLSQMLKETNADPNASESDKAEIEYALTGCVDILNAISLDIDHLHQEIEEGAATNSTTTAATAAAN